MSEYTIPINDLFVRSSVPLGIPCLATDELRIAFIQATSPLCPDVQRKIWEEVLYCTVPIVLYQLNLHQLPRNAVRFHTLDHRFHYPKTYFTPRKFD